MSRKIEDTVPKAKSASRETPKCAVGVGSSGNRSQSAIQREQQQQQQQQQAQPQHQPQLQQQRQQYLLPQQRQQQPSTDSSRGGGSSSSGWQAGQAASGFAGVDALPFPTTGDFVPGTTPGVGGSSSSAEHSGVSRQEAADRESDILRIQEELGFGRYQALEAFKRCSTVESAVDWILDPAREWNQQ
eukprot:TRINITY_DN10095_c0_g1_i2.p1 TRINITY_DN10095_c0_g1~~TRINITY_DN10095_c0_g1_i2.p1  ORF type:complete len:187 (-),score=55.31 TRINITY_DN10095_c0_g1_i2:48-608(-)